MARVQHLLQLVTSSPGRLAGLPTLCQEARSAPASPGRTPSKINKSFVLLPWTLSNYSKHGLVVNSHRETIVEGSQMHLAFGPGERREEPQLQLARAGPENERFSEVMSGVLARHPRHVVHQLFP